MAAVVPLWLAILLLTACGGGGGATKASEPEETDPTISSGNQPGSAAGAGAGQPVVVAAPSVSAKNIDAAKSTVSVSPAGDLVAGTTAIFTLTLRNARGEITPISGLAVSFTLEGGSSNGIIGPVKDNDDGTYTAEFSPSLAGSSVTVGATYDSKPVVSTRPSFSVLPDAFAVKQSTLAVSTSEIVSAAATTIVFTSRDIYGNQLLEGGLGPSFELEGTATGSFDVVTDNHDGTYSVNFTGIKAGNASVYLVLDGVRQDIASAVTVVAGPISAERSVLSVSTTTLSSGADAEVSLSLHDSNDNFINDAGASVLFNLSGGESSGVFSEVAANVDGTYSAVFTAQGAGSPSIVGASINGVALAGILPQVTVVPGAVSLGQSVVSLSSNNVASGAGVTATVTAKDSYGNRLTSGGLTVSLSASGGSSTGSFGSVIDHNDGTYSAIFTGNVSGSAKTITGRIGGSNITSAQPTVTVVPGPVSLSHSTLTRATSSVASGSAVVLTLTAKDGQGNQLTTGGLTVAFYSSGGTSTGTIGAVTDNNNGTYTANFVGVVAGTAKTFSATIGGSSITSTLPTISVTPGPVSLSQSLVSRSAASVASGSAIVVTLTARDDAGNQLSTGGLSVAFSQTGGSSNGSFGTVTSHNNGTYTTYFTGGLSGSATTLRASIGGSQVTSALPTVTVTPGPFSLARSEVTLAASTVSSGAGVGVTLTARDAAGNQLAAGGLAVSFDYSGGSSTGSFGSVTDHGNGTYTASFTGALAGTATTVRASIAGVSLDSEFPSLLVTPGSASLAESTVSASASNLVSGEAITVSLIARDAAGNRLNNGGLDVAFSHLGGTSTGSFGTVTDHGDGSYSASFIGVASGSPTTIRASISGNSLTSLFPTAMVVPDSLSLSQSAVSVGAATVASGSSLTLTLTARDAAGNQLTDGGLTVAFSASGGTSTGSIGPITDQGNGIYTASFAGAIAGSAKAISATIDGVSITSAAPSVAVIPGSVSLSQSTVAIGTTSLSAGATSTVILTARDAAGNQLTSGGLTVTFSIGGGGSSGNISSVIDNNNGTYTATFTATIAGSTATLSAAIGGSAVTSSMPSVTVNPGSASLEQSSVTHSASSVASGSGVAVTLTVRDSYGNQLNSGGLTVAFTATGGSSTGTYGTVTDHGNGTYSAVWTGVLKGTARSLGATIGGAAITSVLPAVTVTQGPMSLSRSSVTVSGTSVASGSDLTVTLTEKDAAGNTATSGGLSVAFARAGGTSNGVFDAVVDNGDGTYSANFTGTASGTATTLSATIDGSAVTSTMPKVTVVPGPADLTASTVTVSSATVVSGNNATVTVTARDAFGNQLSNGGSSVTFAATGGSSGILMGPTVDNNNGTYTATLTGTTAGSATQIQASIEGNLLLSSFPDITVQIGPISAAGSVVTVSAASIQSGSSSTLTLTARDAFGNAISAGGATVSFAHSGGASTGTISAVTDHGDGTYTATFTGVTAGSATTITSQIDGASVSTVLPTIAVSPSSTRIAVITGYPGSTTAGDPHGFDVTITDHASNIITDFTGTIAFASTDMTALLPNNYTFELSDNGTANFIATFKTTGTHSITVTDTVDASITGQQAGITVEAASAARLAISGPVTGRAGICSNAFAVNITDAFGNVTTSPGAVTVNLGSVGVSGGSPILYADSACMTVITSLVIDGGSSNAAYYFKDATVESVSLGASDQDSNLLAANSHVVSVNPYQAWVGAATGNNAFATASFPLRGRFDALLNSPNGVAIDGNGYMYVVDSSNARIQKFDTNDNFAFKGWTGKVGMTPTGGDSNCTSTAVNAATPGWCTGGYATAGTGDGMLSTGAAGAYIYDDYLYVLDVTNTRVTRWDLTTGIMAGWLGKILTTTGMSGSCLAAGVGAAAPTWCTGGTAATTSGTGNGMLSTSARAITGDGTYIYVSDAGNHRIMRWDIATGAFAGWIGKIATVPASPTACSGAAVGAYTPTWCYGGTAASGTGDGHMNAPRGLALDSTYLYVADAGNFRIQRLALVDGAFSGWIGRVNSATGMANYSGLTGCTAASNSPTACWVTGGTAKTATAGMNNNQFSAPYGITLSGSYFYVADASGHRLTKHGLNGAYVGAVGRIASTTNLSTPACVSAGVNNYAPSWCTSSSAAQVSWAQTGETGGMLNAPLAAYSDATYVYVSDTTNHRIARFDAASGEYAGHLGGVGAGTSGWDSTSPSQTPLSGRDDSGLNLPTGVAITGGNIYVADSTNHRIKRYAIETGAFTGWIGSIWTPPTGGDAGCTGAGGSATATFTPGWCTGGAAKTGTGTGMLNTPQGIYTDGTYLYVADQSNHRINKYLVATGAAIGWIGKINSVTGLGGAAGCSSATTGTFTPGWCTGGTSASGTGDGMLNTPQGIEGDGTYLYVADGTNHRISRYVAATGAFAGWTGKIATVPSGGASGCTSAAVGAATPGWCTGGTAATGTGNGHLSTPRDLSYTGTYLYVTDANHRISRFTAITGVFGGWLGRISSTSGLGGAAGCSSAAASSFTPGWCTGGTATSGTGNGMLNAPKGIWGNGTNLWVVDVSNNRISKYNESTGSFVGWSGVISSTSGLGGATGCSTATANNLTPGWCTGGTGKRSTILGAYDAPAYLKGTGSNYLYVTDGNNMRLSRLPQ